MENKIKKSEFSDSEIIAQQLRQCAYTSPRIQLLDESVKEKKDQEASATRSRLESKQFEVGYRTLISAIEKNSPNGIDYKIDGVDTIVPLGDFKIINEELMREIKGSFQEFKNKTRDFSIPQCSKDIILEFYGIAIKLYEDARYQDSINAFIFLTTLYPAIQSFWTGLGLAYEKNLDAMKAIEAFEMAINVDHSNFAPFYGLLRASESIKDYSKAIMLLEEQAENESIKEDVENALSYIKSG